MVKQKPKRWPIWKIVLVLIAFAVGAVLLFVASMYVDAATGEDASSEPGGTASSGMLGGILKLFGAVCVLMVGVCVGWLVIRRQQSVPAWQKRAKLPPHRRK